MFTARYDLNLQIQIRVISCLNQVLWFSPVSNVPQVPIPISIAYQKDKWTKPGNLPESNVFSEIREHCIAKCFHFSHL